MVVDSPKEPLDANTMTEAYVDEGVMVNSGPFNGMNSADAKEAVVAYLEKKVWANARSISG